MQVQVFSANITETKPLKEVEIEKIFNFIKNTPKKHLEIYKKIQNADPKEKAELKKHLFYILPATQVTPTGRRSYNDITGFNGLIHLDFDKVENAQALKYHLFEEYNFIFAAWISASGKGVKCLVKIPEIKIVNGDIQGAIKKYKSYFWGLANTHMLEYQGFDIAPQNAVLPMFLSPDENILIAENSEMWTKKGINPKEIKYKPKPFILPNFGNKKYTKWAIENTKKAIDAINDNGHPQLRAASFSLGGYVGAGYLSEYEAINLIDNLILSNAYLSQKPKTYQKTARTMIRQGQGMPLYFK